MGFKKGYIPWNKNLTKKSDIRVARNAKAIQKANMGNSKCAWSKGLTKETDIRVANNRGSFKKRYIPWIKDLTKETNDKLINLTGCPKGTIPWNKGLKKESDFRVAKNAKSLSQSITGRSLSKEHKRNIRLSGLERIKRIGSIQPGFNENGCKFFEMFDSLIDTRGQYATNGGEKHIKGLGYFVDYFNPKLKLIMEWDESRHYDENGLLKKDVIRQQEIQNLYPDFAFIRIRE